MQLPAINYIHLLADLALSANKIARRVQHRLEPEHQLVEKPGLGVLKYLHPLKRVQMHMNSYLGSQFIRQQIEHLIVIDRFVVRPQKVKPPNDSVLEPLRHSPQRHVRLHRVQFRLKLFASVAQIRHYIAHMAHYRREQEQSSHQLNYSENVVRARLRVGHFGHERHNLRAEVERLQIVPQQLLIIQQRGLGQLGPGLVRVVRREGL